MTRVFLHAHGTDGFESNRPVLRRPRETRSATTSTSSRTELAGATTAGADQTQQEPSPAAQQHVVQG